MSRSSSVTKSRTSADVSASIMDAASMEAVNSANSGCSHSPTSAGSKSEGVARSGS